jgi:hypothetical protein
VFNAAVTLPDSLDLDILSALADPANTFAAAPLESGWELGT